MKHDIYEQLDGFVCEVLNNLVKECKTKKDLYEILDLMGRRLTLKQYMEEHETLGLEDKSWSVDRVESEIKAAEMYYNQYKESRNTQILEIALDEMEHAKIIMASFPDIPNEKRAEFSLRLIALDEEMDKITKKLP